jgi:DNA processing protein
LFLARKAMLIVAAVFAPVAFSGAAAHATRGWVRKWLEFTLAMVFCKIVIVVLFTLAVSLIGTPGSGMAAVGNLFTGLAMLLLACFAPAMLFRLVHYLGGDLIAAHHHSLTTSVARAGATPVAMARTAAVRIGGLTTPATTAAAAASGVTAPGASAATRPSPSGAAVNVPGAATGLPEGKSLTNNPVIKNPGGDTGPATGSTAPPTGPSGPPSGPTATGDSNPAAQNPKPATAGPPPVPLPPRATPPPARPVPPKPLPGT